MNELVTVIVTTRNEEGNIERFWKSVKSQNYKNIECITVDNRSRDRTKQLAAKYSKVYDKGPERSAQRNLAATKSKGRYLIFLDADMELTKGVVRDCVREFNGKVAIIIPERSVGRGYWQSVKVLERNCYINDRDMELPRAYRRDVFFKLGGFDEKITGQEIEDLYNSAIQIGEIGRIDSFIIHHELIDGLWKIAKKKYYYCLTLGRYMNKSRALAKRQAKVFLRPAYIKNWKAFLKRPDLVYGFFIMRIFEGFGALIGLYVGRMRNK